MSAGDEMSEFDGMDGEATLKGDAIIEHDYPTSNSHSHSNSSKGGGPARKASALIAFVVADAVKSRMGVATLGNSSRM